jgi:hypothetical protein
MSCKIIMYVFFVLCENMSFSHQGKEQSIFYLCTLNLAPFFLNYYELYFLYLKTYLKGMFYKLLLENIIIDLSDKGKKIHLSQISFVECMTRIH